MSRKILSGALFAVLLSALAGCGGSGGSGPDAGQDPTPTASSTGPPAPEGTGEEDPAPDGGGGEPAIETVGLPIGISESDEEENCFQVNWSTGGFPDGARVTVPDVDLQGGKNLGGCGGLPSCKGFTFKPDSMACAVKVEVPPGGKATLSARGQVTCSGVGCEEFRSGIKGITPTIEGPSPSPSMSTPQASPSTESPPPAETYEPEPPVQSPDEPLPTG